MKHLEQTVILFCEKDTSDFENCSNTIENMLKCLKKCTLMI